MTCLSVSAFRLGVVFVDPEHQSFKDDSVYHAVDEQDGASEWCVETD